MAPPLLAHEQQWDLRRQQYDCDGCVQRGFSGPRRDACSKRVITNLIMVLQEADKSGGRQFARGLPAPLSAAERRALPLISKPLGERAAEMLCRLGRIVGVISRGLTGRQMM